jgi:molecular chaperone DnaK (HSP70)
MPNLIILFFFAGGLCAMLAHYYGLKGRQFIVGVDLGTTYSVIAIKKTHGEGGVVDIIPLSDGKMLLPSVVSFLDGEVLVGRPARSKRSDHPDKTIYNAKRFIGRTMAESESHATEVPYNVTANGTGPVYFTIGGMNITPVEVGKHVVGVLKDAATAFLGFEPRGAVICVPAKFGVAQTAATREAVEATGLKVQRIMEEPTAAAVAYDLHRGLEPRNVLVYDIGGGTTDVSMLFMNQGSISVQGTHGDEHLGGSDFDEAMYSVLAEKMPDCPEPRLRVLAEDAKIALSGADETTVNCERSLSVTRREFEASSAPLFVRSMIPVDQLLEDLMMEPRHVNDVVLVGGASRTPRLRELLRAKFGGRVHHDIDPDVTVAWGAANILD